MSLEIPHPRARAHLLGHEAAEQAVLARWAAGALPHAFLITGREGIGKAAFAYRVARFLLSQPASPDQGLFGEPDVPRSLSLPESHPVFHRVAAGSHSDLLTVEPVFDEKKGEYKREITVDAVRKIGDFMSMTAGESAWRVVIIDAVDQLNRNAANALLKVLEEPPSHAILLLVSHNPAGLLPTIRSRCQRIALMPPAPEVMQKLLREYFPGLDPRDAEALGEMASASPGLALRLAEEGALETYAALIELLGSGERGKAIEAFIDRATGRGSTIGWPSLELLLEVLLTRLVKLKNGLCPKPLVMGETERLQRAADAKPLDYWLKLWEKSRTLLADTDRVHLDARQALLQVIHAF